MINERMLELSLLLQISEKLPYDKEKDRFIFLDANKEYDAKKIVDRIHDLVIDFMCDYEVNDVIESAEKSV